MPGTRDTPGPVTVLAFDFGLRRIGVAVGQDVTRSASPLGIIGNSDAGIDHQAIARHIAEWQPDRLIVGLPLNADGSRSDMQQSIADFATELNRYGLPIQLVDERHTSSEAEAALKRARASGARGRIRRAHVDSAAAVLIAERYLKLLA